MDNSMSKRGSKKRCRPAHSSQGLPAFFDSLFQSFLDSVSETERSKAPDADWKLCFYTGILLCRKLVAENRKDPEKLQHIDHELAAHLAGGPPPLQRPIFDWCLISTPPGKKLGNLGSLYAGAIAYWQLFTADLPYSYKEAALNELHATIISLKRQGGLV